MKYTLRILSVLFALCAAVSPILAQDVSIERGRRIRDINYPKARVSEVPIHSLDLAREVKQFDATPDGRNWLLVDGFALWESIMINGVRHPKEFHQIPPTTAQISRDGNYVIWMGQIRQATEDDYNATRTTLYKGLDSIATFVSDYNALSFSRDGKQWAALFPYANEKQTEDKNSVVLNGEIIAKNGDAPLQFTFGHGTWSYRTSGETKESLVTPEGTKLLLERPAPIMGGKRPYDSLVWHYAPHVLSPKGILEGRDHSIGEADVMLFKTSYRAEDQKNVLSYIVWKGKPHTPSRWINSITLDSTGTHLAYFSCDPQLNNVYQGRDERAGIVVYNGKHYDGPYRTLERLFMSPSGKHLAYSVASDSAKLILDKKEVGPAVQVIQCVWSSDEKHIAFASIDGRGKISVIVNGKASPEYQNIGKIGWSKDGNFVEYLAIRNNKILKVKQLRK